MERNFVANNFRVFHCLSKAEDKTRKGKKNKEKLWIQKRDEKINKEREKEKDNVTDKPDRQKNNFISI